MGCGYLKTFMRDMLHFEPDQSPQKDPPEPSLAERSLGGMVRVSFAGLDRTTHQYGRALASLCLLMHARRVVVMDESAQAAVKDLDVFEWNLPYPDDVRPRSFPFFPGDRSKHDEMARLEREYVRLKRAQSAGERFQGTFHTEPIHPNTPNTYPRAIAAVEQQLDDLFDTLRRRCGRGISVPEGRMRTTDFGDLLLPLLHDKPLETGAAIVRIVLRAEDVVGKVHRRTVAEHVGDLWEVAGGTQPNRALRVQSFNRHLRKLGIAILEGQLSFARDDLADRTKKILAEGHVDTYLAGATTRAQQHRHQQAYEWLRGWYEGQHGSVPYPSWQREAKEECFGEAFKIVMRARHQSYHSFGRLRMETRSFGGNLPLFREFAMDCFQETRFIRCDNGDLPPGRGTFMAGADLDKLFHGLNPDRDVLHDYRRDEGLWFADQLVNLETASVVALRQWIGVSAPSEDFALFGERYYYVIDNDHFSGSYGFAFGFPAASIETKVRYASYGLDDGPHLAADAHEARLSIPDLIEATRESGKAYLMLGHMSPLFGGMCNALPVASKPVFGWEANHQAAVWRDVYGHVHWPWLVHSYRDHRSRVEATITPLATADREIRHFAKSGQKLFEAVRHRYGAWKNDLTPGDLEAPRMLERAYDIFHEHLEHGARGELAETIYVGAVDRSRPEFDPIPLLNCFNLELSTRHVKSSAFLPRDGDGTGEREVALWRRYVSPLIEVTTKDGEAFEGPYELVLIGENDIRRSQV